MPHDFYIKDNLGLHIVKEIDLYDAMLGGEGELDIFGDKLKFNIPACTQNTSSLRLKGKGFPQYNNPETRCDVYVRIMVSLPSSLTDEERDLFIQLKNLKQQK